MLLDLVSYSYELVVSKKREATPLPAPHSPLPIPQVPIPIENNLQGWLDNSFNKYLLTSYYEQMDAVAWGLFDVYTQCAALQQTPRLQAKQAHWWRHLPPCSERARRDARNHGS